MSLIEAYRIYNKEHTKHLDCGDDTFDTARFFSEDEVAIVFIHESVLRTKSVCHTNCADNFLCQCCPLCVMIQRPFLMLLHDCRCHNDRNCEGGDNAHEDECHLPLLDKRNYECCEKHGDGMNRNCHLF